jgi:methyltransferase (TIGR00027 family)
MTASPFPEGVGLTALTTAYARAQESRRAAPLFTDPLAALFVAEAAGKPGIAGAPLPRLGPARDDGASPLWDSIYSHVTGRTPFYDRFVRGAVASGCRQVVLLGAGLDVRAFRLPLDPGTTVYEVDTPAVLDFKAGVLARHAAKRGVRRVPVETDLRDDWPGALRAAGFDRDKSAAWLAEGLLFYLAPAEADVLLSEITAQSAPGSLLAGEYMNRRIRLDDVPLDDDGEGAVAEFFVTAVRGGPQAEPERWLSAHGWLGRQRDFVDELIALGRHVPALFDPRKPDPLRLWLFSASPIRALGR